MKIQLLRNASLMLSVNGKNILIDPMLAPKDSYPSIQGTSNTLLNPTTDLPFSSAELEMLIEETDAVLLTHLHNDHWDPAARALLNKNIIVYCQPGDVETISEQGFTHVKAIGDQLNWEGIQITRTNGQHGTGDIGRRMGSVSGYVIRYEHDNVYIAGDTIWCPEVQHSIDLYQPTNIILNGGGARFVSGDPIVMDTKDIMTVCTYTSSSHIFVVHMEAVNHSMESRILTRSVIASNYFDKRCFVPEDGEIFINT